MAIDSNMWERFQICSRRLQTDSNLWTRVRICGKGFKYVIESNLFPQIAIFGHRLKYVGTVSNLLTKTANRFESVRTESNLWAQILNCGHRLQSVGTDSNSSVATGICFCERLYNDCPILLRYSPTLDPHRFNASIFFNDIIEPFASID